MQVKPRATSQQAQRDKSYNFSKINGDYSLDESINASFALNNSRFIPTNNRHVQNYSFDTAPRSRSGRKSEQPSGNHSMYNSEFKARVSSKELITDSKYYYTSGMLNTTTKKTSNAKKHFI